MTKNGWLRRILAMVITLIVSACADSPPAIGSHLPGTFSVASDAFDQRVKARFPIGLDETALRAQLTQERFIIRRDEDSPFSFSANYHANELFCAADWVIRWSVFEGKVAAISGNYKEICL
jgi:hypothetical protein